MFHVMGWICVHVCVEILSESKTFNNNNNNTNTPDLYV